MGSIKTKDIQLTHMKITLALAAALCTINATNLEQKAEPDCDYTLMHGEVDYICMDEDNHRFCDLETLSNIYRPCEWFARCDIVRGRGMRKIQNEQHDIENFCREIWSLERDGRKLDLKMVQRKKKRF